MIRVLGVVMKKFVAAAALAALGFVGVASAADMSTKVPVMAAPTPVFSWTGFYLGAQGGAAWSNSTIDEQASFGNNSGTATNSIKNNSGEVGIYGGYNYQFSQGFILGGEADFNWTHLSGVTPPFALTSSGDCASAGASTQICVGPVTSNVRWYGTVRGTVGLTADRLLLYATGGLAYGEVEHSVAGTLRVTTVNLPPFSVDESAVRYGWTVGLGTAVKVTDNISLRLQWNYVDLGRHTVFATSGSVLPGGLGPAVPFSVSVKEDRIAFNTIRAGFAFHFQ
jgi:outer membrane immunogenic protein